MGVFQANEAVELAHARWVMAGLTVDEVAIGCEHICAAGSHTHELAYRTAKACTRDGVTIVLVATRAANIREIGSAIIGVVLLVAHHQARRDAGKAFVATIFDGLKTAWAAFGIGADVVGYADPLGAWLTDEARGHTHAGFVLT